MKKVVKEKISEIDEVESTSEIKSNKKNKKPKKHFDLSKQLGRVVALLIVIMMLVATCGTVIYYLINVL